jgi:ADP-ribosylglycohydrolase
VGTRPCAVVAEGVSRIVHEGGDADANAAVAGALPGARDGYSAIPAKWVVGLARESELRERADRLTGILDETTQWHG